MKIQSTVDMKFIGKVSLAIIGLFLTICSYSQHSNTLYHIKGIVPQRYLMNPAFQPECGFHAGLPGISPLDGRIRIPFNMADVMYYDAELDSTVTFLHPAASKSLFTNNIRKNNILYSEYSTGIASLGFKAAEIYISFDIRQKGYTNLSIPGDFLNFLLEFNENGESFNFSRFNFTSRLYNEFSMGLSKQFTDYFTFGVRGKLLFGIADVSMNNSNMNLHTTKDQWTVNTDFQVNANVPFMRIPLNEDGNYALDSIEFDEDIYVSDIITESLFNNFGLGLDLGLVYKPVDKINLSVSLADLGFIGWKSNVYNLSQQTTFEFDGVTIDSINSEKFGDYLIDSLQQDFGLDESRNPYNTFLPSRLYIGGQYVVNPNFSLGLMSMSEIFNKNLRQEFTVSTNFSPGKYLALSLSYSYLNYSFNNLGFGMSSTIGPLNMYLVLDHLPVVLAREVNSNVIIPHKTKNLNFKLGFNLVFGCNREKRLMKDKPMVE